MRLTKKQRIELHAKFAGHCAYCGCELCDRWHADHFEPVIRLADERVAEQPANHSIGNMMPACAPCNISKGRQTLEGWRQWLAGHINSLNSYTPIYRIAKAYGLIVETGKPLVFHFETVGSLNTSKYEVIMSSDSRKRIDPGKTYRRQAGPYDVITSTPRYSFEVIAADDDARSRVSDNSQIMGVTGRHFFVWDITNNAHTSVFVTLTKDGEPFDPEG